MRLIQDLADRPWVAFVGANVLRFGIAAVVGIAILEGIEFGFDFRAGSDLPTNVELASDYAFKFMYFAVGGTPLAILYLTLLGRLDSARRWRRPAIVAGSCGAGLIFIAFIVGSFLPQGYFEPAWLLLLIPWALFGLLLRPFVPREEAEAQS